MNIVHFFRPRIPHDLNEVMQRALYLNGKDVEFLVELLRVFAVDQIIAVLRRQVRVRCEMDRV